MKIYKDLKTIDIDVSEIDAINNSLKNILLTAKGSVPGKPYFGSDLYKLVFSHLDHLTETVAKNFIQEAIYNFEDRIQITSIELESVYEYNKLLCTINYTFRDKLSILRDANFTLPISG